MMQVPHMLQMLDAKVESTLIAAVLLVVVAYPLHECGHLLALKLPGRWGALGLNGVLGLSVKVPADVQGWRGALVAAAGPAANLAVMWLALALNLQTLAQVNFVLAAVNLLPILPLDGGRVVLGLLSGVVAWRRLRRVLLFLARGWAVALVLCVYYFGLSRWLVVAALWLYLLAMWEDGRTAAELAVGLVACRGQRLRPVRHIRLYRDEALWQVVRRMSPGWRNIVHFKGRKSGEDELLELWQNGAGAVKMSELLKDWRIKKD